MNGMNEAQQWAQPGSPVMFDKDVLNAAKGVQIAMIVGYGNCIIRANMIKAARGQMPANNFMFKFNDVANMSINAAGIHGLDNQQLTAATLPQANQMLPQQPQQPQVTLEDIERVVNGAFEARGIK